MPQTRSLLWFGLTLLGPVFLQAQETGFAEPDCPFFGPQRERFYTDAFRRDPVAYLQGLEESLIKQTLPP